MAASGGGGIGTEGQILGRLGPADEVPLGQIAADGAEQVERFSVLDALGHDAQSECVAEIDGGPHEFEVTSALSGGQAGDEGAVQFEFAHGQVAQIGEGGESGSEVVDGDDESEAPEFLDDARATVRSRR